jgi:SAM-dependent methyltransferase
MQHAHLAPSPWLLRFAPLIRPGGTVLDVACGSGRHVRWLAERGFHVTGVDRDAAALVPLADLACTVVADIESEPWPLTDDTFDAVLVTNYLWRPLFPVLRQALKPDGVLIYETFAVGHERFGKPSNPNFLLQAGELLQLAQGLHCVAYEDGLLNDPPRCVQRIAALGAQRNPKEAAL